MKLLRYGPPGHEQPGLLDANGCARSLAGIVGDIDGEAISPEGLDILRGIDPTGLSLVPQDARIGPCVGGVGKLIGIGLNYSDHAAEANMRVPREPIVFMKATSSIAGPYDPVILPANAVKTDWELELALAIGTRARNVPEIGRCRMSRAIASSTTSPNAAGRPNAKASGPRAKAMTDSARWARGW